MVGAPVMDRGKPWFWLIRLPFRGDRRHPWHGSEVRAKRHLSRSVAEQEKTAFAAPGAGSTGMTGVP
jgi:hypothetical protein